MIAICGLGAIGSHIAKNLVFAGYKDLLLIDKDKVEARNYQFGTQLYDPEQLGKNKTEALWFNIFRQTNVVVTNRNIDIAQMLKKQNFQDISLLVDCLDNYEARKATTAIGKDMKVPVLHVGFSPVFTYQIQWDGGYETPSDAKGHFDICEMQGARAFIEFVSGLATNILIDYLESGKLMSLIGNKYSITQIK